MRNGAGSRGLRGLTARGAEPPRRHVAARLELRCQIPRPTVEKEIWSTCVIVGGMGR